MWETEEARRLRVLMIVTLGVIVVLLGRLAWMQVLQGSQYKKISDANRIRQATVQAPRGAIYDRRAALVVSSRPSFAVSIIPDEYENTSGETGLLSQITGVLAADIENLLVAAKDYPFTPVRVRRDIDQSLMARIEERRADLPGVIVEAIPVRHYVYNNLASHLLGYVGVINEEEFAQKRNLGYHPTDLVGKDGIELEWENALRGRDGGMQVEVNAEGIQTEVLGEKVAAAGKSLILFLDANLQKTAEDALEIQMGISRELGERPTGGAVVVLDVQTGGVLAWASYPSYNPNAFAGGISSKEWDALINNPNTPLNNRVIQNAFPPGSVFKIVTAAAALDGGFTNGQEVFEDRGVYVLNGWSFYGWEPKGLGRLTVADALTYSSDPVFYELGHRMGADTLASYALTFGFGVRSGVKLPGEVSGNVPTEEWKTATYGEQWYPGETLIAAIGQGYYLATPLQQALLLMAVANEGIVYRPLLVDRVLSEDGSQIVEQAKPEVIHTVYLKPEYWQIIKQGLTTVVTKGTAASVFQDFKIPIAGKTGSAETGTGTTHSWFACYAPAEKPQIAMAVFIENGGEGSVSAAPITRKILDAYFNIPIETPPLAMPGHSD